MPSYVLQIIGGKYAKEKKECLLEEWLWKDWQMHSLSQEKIPEILDVTLKTLAAAYERMKQLHK